MKIATWVFLATLAVALTGCTVANWMGSQDPGTVPRAGQLTDVSGIGGDQVRFTFTFKSGADPEQSAVPQDPVGSEPVAASRISNVIFTDRGGRSFPAADEDIRRDDNLYTVTLTSGPVKSETYEVVCQGRVTIGGYLVKLTSSAYREVDGWRAEPRSFTFAVYRAGQSTP